MPTENINISQKACTFMGKCNIIVWTIYFNKIRNREDYFMSNSAKKHNNNTNKKNILKKQIIQHRRIAKILKTKMERRRASGRDIVNLLLY